MTNAQSCHLVWRSAKQVSVVTLILCCRQQYLAAFCSSEPVPSSSSHWTDQPAAFRDISNAGRGSAVTLSRGKSSLGGPAAQQVAQEADSVARCTQNPCPATAARSALGHAANFYAGDAMDCSDDEPNCIVRAAPRRSTRAAGARTRSQPQSTDPLQPKGPTPDEATDDYMEQQKGKALGGGGAEHGQQHAAKAPARRTGGRGNPQVRSPITGKENSPDGVREAATPALKPKGRLAAAAPMTTGHKSRFAAMQPETPMPAQPPPRLRSAAATCHVPRRITGAAADLPGNASMTVQARPERGLSRRQVSFAEEAAEQVSLHPSKQQQQPRACPATSRQHCRLAKTSKSAQDLAPTHASDTPFKIRTVPLTGELQISGVDELDARVRALSLDPPPQAASLSSGGPKKDDHCGGSLPRGPVLLILDPQLQSLPWESLPCLKDQRCWPTCQLLHAACGSH